MGSMENRGRGSWRIGIQVKTPNGWKWVRETIHLDPLLSDSKQRKEAEHALAHLQTQIDCGEKGPPGQHYTVAQWAEIWLSSEVKPNCSPVTYANYRHLLHARIIPMLGDVGLARLTPVRLTEWMGQLRESPRRSTRLPDQALSHARSPSRQLKPCSTKPLSAKTLLNYYQCMDTMLGVAVRLGVIDANPMDKVKRPTQKRKKVQFLDEDQAVRLLRCLKDEPNMCYRAAVLLALLCGLRLGEVGELKLSDIDWQRCTIDISRTLKYTSISGNFIGDPKSEASRREIALPAGMMAVLRETQAYQEECKRLAPNVWRGEGWIVHAWDGAQLHHDTPSKWFRRFADAHGFEGVRFHDLRHTHASILLANNIDVVSVAHRMGHEDPSVTLRIYAHALDQRDRDAADKLDSLFGGVEMPGADLPHPV